MIDRYPLLLTLTLIASTICPAQAPGSLDAEGNRYAANGMGRYPLRRQGVWKVGRISNPHGSNREQSATAAEVQAMNATLESLSQIMRATPEAAKLEGYWVNEPRGMGHLYAAERPPELAAVRYPLLFDLGIYPFYLEDILRNGKYVPVFAGETASVYFWFNRLPGSYGRHVITEENFPNQYKAPIYLRPRVTGTYKGFPVIEEQDLLITRANRDPWSPVSYAKALRLSLQQVEKDRQTAEQRLAGLKKKNEETQAPAYEQQMREHLEKYSGTFRTTNPEKWKGRVASMERELKYNRELAAQKATPQRDKDGFWYWNAIDAHAETTKRIAALTTADETTAACFVEAKGPAKDGRYAMYGNIERAGSDPACVPLVTDNFNYFDFKLPRSAPQLLLVRSIGRCGKVKNGQLIPNVRIVPDQPAHGCARHPVFWEQMDWAKVGALLVQ